MKLIRFGEVGAVLLAASGLAFASEGNNGNPEYSASAFGNYANYTPSVFISGNQGNGSGAMYNVESYMNAGTQTLVFNVATAAHVLSGQTANTLNVGISLGGNFLNLNSTNAIQNIQYRGSGSYALPEDLAYISYSTTEAQVGAEDWNALLTLLGTNPTLGIGGAQNDKLTNIGYGLSGKYLIDDYDPTANTHTTLVGDTFTPGVQANGDIFTGLGYESEGDFGANYASGIDRMTNTTSAGIFDFTNGAYQYNAVTWLLQDAAGYGQINSGDSGGAILDNGKLIGLNTFADGSPYTTGAGVKGEDFYYGTEGAGLAFNQADINWLNNLAAGAVPEPMTMVGFGIAAMALIRRRRR